MNENAETSRTELPETRPEMVEGGEAERSAFAVHRDPPSQELLLTLVRGWGAGSRGCVRLI